MQALETVALDPPGLRLDHVGRPARLVVQKVYRRSYRHNTREVLVGGCIVSGQLSVGDRVVIQPSNVNGDVVVESIESHHQPRRAVFGPHESVAVRLRWLRTTAASDTVSKKEATAEAESEAEVEEEAEEVTNKIAAEAEPRLVDLVERGSVIVPQGDDQPRRVKSIKAQVIISAHPGMLKSGYTPTLRVHAATVPCTFKLISSVRSRMSNRNRNVVGFCSQSHALEPLSFLHRLTSVRAS
jgi:translation elongation factor EF-1alpha